MTMTRGTTRRMLTAFGISLAGGAAVLAGLATQAGPGLMPQVHAQAPPFHVEEATIDELQNAIRQGQTTCTAIVQQYVARAKAYNGVPSVLLTADGTPVPQAYGTVRGGSPLKFPTQTVKASTILPNLDQYAGPPLEFGRMEATASDPTVQQQYGMIVGLPDAGQANALATINIRGERSVTCKGDFDKAPSAGALPANAPAVCQEFRKQPDAIERAAELDAQYGRAPDLAAMPMYCVPFSFKDPFDTKDMRSTGGADARYDIDFPARDHQLVEQLRMKGAIIYAKAVLTEYNGRAGNPGGRHEPTKVLHSNLGYQRSTWGGNPSNVYDTTRAGSLGSSSGSAVGVSANLVMCSLCEETRASCRGPANHNSVALILPHNKMIGFDGGAIGSDIYNDRTGIHCRNVLDSAKVLDALRDTKTGYYYDPREPFSTVPRSSVLNHPYADTAGMPGTPGSLRGMRIGIVRESMVSNPGIKATEPIVQAAAAEIKTILGHKLGATLVESVDPLFKNDPDVEDMTTPFTTALAKLVPVFMPDILFRVDRAGTPLFPDVAAAIKPTEFEPGKKFGTGTMEAIDYLVALADGTVKPPSNFNIRTVQQQQESNAFRYHMVQYMTRRAADWKKLGFTETTVDFPALNARSKFWGDDQRAAFKNWEDITDIRNPLTGRQGINERIMLRELLRRVDMLVIYENHLVLLVRLHTPLPPAKIGGANQPGTVGNESAYGPNAGLTEVLIPAGYVKEVYDAKFALA
ncbi:MAG: amidase family protein, partial [Vicinamibacterales bacterium]